jgi:monosaccharide-transporting ATPase
MADPALLTMTAIDKSFAGVPALTDVNFSVAPGEVRALIGQNGAGKSTLIKVLTGVYRRDSGRVTFCGKEVDFTSTQEAQNAGVATIYQEVNLIPFRSVAENICIGRAPRRRGLIDWKGMATEANRRLEALDIHVDVTRPLYEYPIATQQMTAIARALSFEAQLVIMDEPTSSLAEHEVQILLDVIRRLKSAGVAVVFVSHRLDELYTVCDTITVLRDGAVVADADIGSLSKYDLVATMLGRQLTDAEARGRHLDVDRAADAQVVVEASDLRRPPSLNGSSVRVRKGEIVGLAGLLGSGRSETARVLFGVDRAEGEVVVDGKKQAFTSPRDAIRARIGFCSEDRKAEGIIPDMSVRENLTLALLPRMVKRGLVDRKQQQAVVSKFVDRLGIKLASADQKIRELSGGNQQKVLLARWLCTNPQMLILDEPTRGIDVGAKQEIQAFVKQLAEDEDLSVLFISSELEELITTCDRVLVLRDGATVRELTGREITEQAMLQAMAEGHAATDSILAAGGIHD